MKTTIAEAQNAKEDLEADILTMVKDYINKYGLKIKSLDLKVDEIETFTGEMASEYIGVRADISL